MYQHVILQFFYIESASNQPSTSLRRTLVLLFRYATGHIPADENHFTLKFHWSIFAEILHRL